MSCGNSRSSKCNPCGPSEAAMNAIADKSAYYARMAQYTSDGFNQVYLGAKDVAPITDNNGNPIVEGALYFNTVNELLYAWDGLAWVSAIVGTNTVTTNTAQTITGQKTFTQNILANGGVTGAVTGNASTATTLQTGRTITISGAVTGTATSFNGSTDISIPATISSGATIASPNLTGTATGNLASKIVQGVTDGSNASVGYIGEVIQGTSALTAITSNSIVNGASITLTPGDWEVYANATFNFSGVSAVAGDLIGAAVSLVPLTLPNNQRQVLLIPAITNITQTPAFAFVTPRVRVNVTTNTAIYIVVQSPVFTIVAPGTGMQFSSIITANRVR